MKTQIKKFTNDVQLADSLALEFQNIVHLATHKNRNFFVALSGGSTPTLFFQKLASLPYRDSLSWNQLHFFWVDERCVPPDHSDSNFGMAQQKLFAHISIAAQNVHRIHGENDPGAEVIRYSQLIKNTVPTDNSGFPQFDWILLGIGTDGHTASIFPGSAVIENQKDICAVATHPETGQKRITLTLPVINHAKRVTFLVTGKNKASIVSKIIGAVCEDESFPATFVKSQSGRREWYLDQQAASLIIT